MSALSTSPAHAATSLPSDATDRQPECLTVCKKKRATRILQAKNVKLMEMAKSEKGVSIADIVDTFKVSKEKARDMIASLRERKYITGQVKAWGATRYFDTPERASEYKPDPVVRAAKKAPSTHWPLNLPGTPVSLYAPKREAVAVEPTNVKRTACPNWTHDPRYQMPPGVQPFGAGFAAAGVGRYLEA